MLLIKTMFLQDGVKFQTPDASVHLGHEYLAILSIFNLKGAVGHLTQMAFAYHTRVQTYMPQLVKCLNVDSSHCPLLLIAKVF